MKTKKVFLGGTCNDSKWRDLLKLMLKIDFFDPVVKDWTEECMAEEIKQRKECDYCLYVITPKMTGVYSIAEVVDDSNKRPEKTIFCVLQSDGVPGPLDGVDRFTEAQSKSIEQVAKLVSLNGVAVFCGLDDVAYYLNHED